MRVAESSTFYALPEGQRGVFVGGGGSVRLPRLIGVARMMEMMLTGRVYRAEEGYAIGFSHYVVPVGEGFAKAMELARKIAGNAGRTNFALIHALPRIAEGDPRRRLSHRGADGRDRAGRRAGQIAAARLPGQTRGQGRPAA